MPVVIVAAADLGCTGYESVAELEGDADLAARVQALRIKAGELMGLGDVSGTTVPKVSLVAAPAHGGTISTRTFIPLRVHESIGVLGAVSVATAVLLDGAVGHDLAALGPATAAAPGIPARLGTSPGSPAAAAAGGAEMPEAARLEIEHPSGSLGVEVEVDAGCDPPRVLRSGVVRTARKLFDGTVFPRPY
jgi:4-oxalomesaconate tautomerase